ncbi:MAG TPA: hypothetical protein DDY13_01045 [Cytophagales bacterium]|jgi:hypothetical protein|nr:hypothetical protein [Cytophagales bacterium]
MERVFFLFIASFSLIQVSFGQSAFNALDWLEGQWHIKGDSTSTYFSCNKGRDNIISVQYGPGSVNEELKMLRSFIFSDFEGRIFMNLIVKGQSQPVPFIEIERVDNLWRFSTYENPKINEVAFYRKNDRQFDLMIVGKDNTSTITLVKKPVDEP